MFFQRLALAISFITVFLLKTDTFTSIHGALPSTFRLPAMPGVTLTVTQGNGDGQGVIDHIQANGSFYAFDFAVGQTDFIVTAAQGGTVIGTDDSSTIGCTTLSCWTQANYVLIANDDGKTAVLYLHLLHNSLKVQLGMHVNQGDPLALADTTGFTTGPHLHFQVENVPSTSAQQQKPSGWWWTQSQPVHFSSPEVLAQDPDGIPRTDQSFVVSGTSASQPITVPGNMSGFSQFVGTWLSIPGHGNLVEDRTLIIHSDGTATYTGYADVQCSVDPRPPCDPINGGGLNTRIVFNRVVRTTADRPTIDGTIVSGTGDRNLNEKLFPVGSTITATLTPYFYDVSFYGGSLFGLSISDGGAFLPRISKNNPQLAQYLPYRTNSYTLSYNPYRNVYVSNFLVNPDDPDNLDTQFEKAKADAIRFIQSKGIDIHSVVIEWRHS